jgi:hypothetical protein
MAANKTNVVVKKMSVKDIFDTKYKSKLPDVMQDAAEAAVKASGKLQLGPPKEKGAKCYIVDGTLVSLAPDSSAKHLEGACSMSISAANVMKALPSGKAGVEIKDADSVTQDDVNAVAAAAVTGAMKEAVKYMEKNAP